MDLIEQILQQARETLACPVCMSRYSEEALKFRGFIDSTYIFQGYCANSHAPVAVTYLASLQQLGKPISTYFHTLSGEKIDYTHVKEAEEELDKIDKDITKLWRS